MIALRPFGLEVEATARAVPRVEVDRPAPDPADRADRARRHRDRERAAGRGPQRRRDRHPQRQLQLHGPGPVLLPAPARRAGRGHRDDDADRARRAGDPTPTSTTRRRGPDRGDEPATAAIVTELGDHRAAGCRSSSWRSSWRCSPRWACASTRRRSTRPTTATPGWSTSRSTRRKLHAPIDKIHPMPFPGLNIDNLPFFAVIAATRRGLDADPRLGLRQPRDLPDRADPARAPRCRLLDPHRIWSRARPAGPAPRWSARRRCGRRGRCCWRCWRPRAPRCCATSTSSTAATSTWPSG